MLKHDRARSFTDALANQWLRMKDFPRARPTTEFFPTFHDELKKPMVQEVRMAVDHLRTADRPILDLLDADYTFVNERLAQHYGIHGVTGPDFRRVDLAADSPRRGILGKASILTTTSVPTRTSPAMA